MIRKTTVNLLLPLTSILLFFGSAELILYLVDFRPVLNVRGNEIPFWARNAPSALKALNRMVEIQEDLSEDVNAYEEDLYLFYRLRPDLAMNVSFYDLSGMVLRKNFPTWSIVTSHDGRRISAKQTDTEASTAGASGKEIIFLGGSSIFGWGTDYENTCSHQLEVLLRKQYPKAQVRIKNYAVPGYALSQHLTVLKEMIAGKELPELIVLDATSNCDVPTSITDKQRERIRLKSLNRLRFHLGRLRCFQFLEMLIGRSNPVILEGGSTRPREPMVDYEDYLREFIDLAADHEIRLIMVGICAGKDYLDKMISLAKSNNNTVTYIDFFEIVDKYTRDFTMIPFTDDELELYRSVYPREVLEEDPSLYLLFPDKCHPNPTGHRVLALALSKKIKELGLLN